MNPSADSEAFCPFRSVEKKFKAAALPAGPQKKKQKKVANQKKLNANNSGNDSNPDMDPMFAEAIDLTHLDQSPPEVVAKLEPFPLHTSDPAVRQCLSPEAQAFQITSAPGFIVIRNALTVDHQLYWAWRALSDWSNADHTNLSNLYGAQPNAWVDCVSSGDLSALKKLRWSSLGYHYNWTLRRYTKDDKTAFPNDLSIFSSALAAAVGLDIVSEAGIVNFYPPNSQMGAHIDDAELAKVKPIVSMSLGDTAIFLMGGREKSQAPLALKLRSGDVTIMGGESRLCYHAVPRIIADSFAYARISNLPPHISAILNSSLPAPSPSASPSVSAAVTQPLPASGSNLEESKSMGTSPSSIAQPSTSPSPAPTVATVAPTPPPALDYGTVSADGPSSTIPQSGSAPTCARALPSAAETKEAAPASLDTSSVNLEAVRARLSGVSAQELRMVVKYLSENRLNINARQVEGQRADERFDGTGAEHTGSLCKNE